MIVGIITLILVGLSKIPVLEECPILENFIIEVLPWLGFFVVIGFLLIQGIGEDHSGAGDC